jgi:hypothetical protein
MSKKLLVNNRFSVRFYIPNFIYLHISYIDKSLVPIYYINVKTNNEQH